MTKNTFRNPTDVYPPSGKYSHSVQIPPGARILYIAGQIGYDEHGNLPSDIEGQAENVYANIVKVLKDANMDVEDLVKSNIYMVNPSDIRRFSAAGRKYLGDHAWAGTLVFVKALASPELLLEIEAVAAKQD